jgi:hypothetical protein
MKVKNFLKVLIYLLFLVLNTIIYSQNSAYLRIVDSETKKPLWYPLVKFEGCLMSCRGDSVGIAALKDIPDGTHSFIILNCGYYKDSITLVFPNPYQNDTLIVEIRKNIELFKKLSLVCQKDTSNSLCFCIIDIETFKPVWGAITKIFDEPLGAETDSLGIAIIQNVPVGFNKIITSYVGYVPQIITLSCPPTEHHILIVALNSYDVKVQPRYWDGGPLLASVNFQPDDAYYRHILSIIVKLGEYPLEKANVSLENQTAKFEKLTDSNGYSKIENIPNGIYILKIIYRNRFERTFPIVFNNGFFCIRDGAEYDEYDGWLNYFKIRIGKLTVATSN